MRRLVIILLFAGLLGGCAFTQELKKAIPERRGSKPVISDSYAPRNVKPGEVWKIFLEAEDVDGDMHEFVSSIVPSTRSILKYDFTPIKPEESRSISGYLFVSTPLSSYLAGEKFDVTISIRDRAGNRSEPVAFHLEFNSDAGGGYPEKWQVVSERSLGGVFSDYLSQYARGLRYPSR